MIKDGKKEIERRHQEYIQACSELTILQNRQHLLRQCLKILNRPELKNQDRDVKHMLRTRLIYNRGGLHGLKHLNKITRQYWQQKD